LEDEVQLKYKAVTKDGTLEPIDDNLEAPEILSASEQEQESDVSDEETTNDVDSDTAGLKRLPVSIIHVQLHLRNGFVDRKK
jgi:hypothetical protein